MRHREEWVEWEDSGGSAKSERWRSETFEMKSLRKREGDSLGSAGG